jgi:hypothetical protein
VEEVVSHVVEEFDHRFDDQARLGLLPARVVSGEPREAISQMVAVRAVVMNVDYWVPPARAFPPRKLTQALSFRIHLPEDGVPMRLREPKNGSTIRVEPRLLARIQLRPSAHGQGDPKREEGIEWIAAVAGTNGPSLDEGASVDGASGHDPASFLSCGRGMNPSSTLRGLP